MALPPDSSSTTQVEDFSEVVVLVHGIRDFALWQNAVRTTLQNAGFRVEVTNYGRLNLFRFLLPFSALRKYAVQAVTKQIRMVALRYPGKRISIIAHSFGTYIISSLLRDEFDLRLHRVIFCGSVVRYDFPYEQCLEKFEPDILNDVGTEDIWPAIAESITLGYGSAGTYGFRRPYVVDRWHNGADHGYFLKPDFVNQYWVPFLESRLVVPGSNPADEPSPWIKLITTVKIKYIIACSIMLGLFATVLSIFYVHPEAKSDSTQTQTNETIAASMTSAEPSVEARPVNKIFANVDIGYSEQSLLDSLRSPQYNYGRSDVQDTDEYLLDEDLKRAGTYFSLSDNVSTDQYFKTKYRQSTWRIENSLLIVRFNRIDNTVSAIRVETPLDTNYNGTCLDLSQLGAFRDILTSGKQLCVGDVFFGDFNDSNSGSIISPSGWDATCNGEVNPGGVTGHGSYLSIRCLKSEYPNSPLHYDIELRRDGPEAVQDSYHSFGSDEQSTAEADKETKNFFQTYGNQKVNVVEMYSSN